MNKKHEGHSFITPFDLESFDKYSSEVLDFLRQRDDLRKSIAKKVFESVSAYSFDNPNLTFVKDKKTGKIKVKNVEGEELNILIRNLLNYQTIGYFIEIVLENATASRQSAAALKRHAEHRAMKEDVFVWLDSNMSRFNSMDKAAEAITGKIAPIAWRTARDWVGEWKKLRSTGTP